MGCAAEGGKAARLDRLEPEGPSRVPALQYGVEPPSAKALKGFGGRSVQELVENSPGGTYRAVYTVRFAEAVYVLHCFQKKAKRGIATPKAEIDLIRRRLQEAAAVHQRRRGGE